MIAEAVRAIGARSAFAPDAAVILGTGLSGLAERMDVAARVPYAEIPGFPLSTVESHPGELLLGTLAGRRVAAMRGRFHRYEGYTLDQVVFPVRVLHALGARVLVVSNACGGMHPAWQAGDLMVIADHINLLGDNPLVGAEFAFADLSAAYDPALRTLAHQVARAQHIPLREGVYVAVPGPNLETRAEYRMLRALGADVVGMSTVPEVIVAVSRGMRVLGLSIITDLCLPATLEPASLDRIIAVATQAEPRLTELVCGILHHLN
jgi:purine-nucleoside phosphorylase